MLRPGLFFLSSNHETQRCPAFPIFLGWRFCFWDGWTHFVWRCVFFCIFGFSICRRSAEDALARWLLLYFLKASCWHPIFIYDIHPPPFATTSAVPALWLCSQHHCLRLLHSRLRYAYEGYPTWQLRQRHHGKKERINAPQPWSHEKLPKGTVRWSTGKIDTLREKCLGSWKRVKVKRK